ncbi:MAG: DUF3021 domain-containing protein [Clostridiales bacterium]|nr:DUF3021 domain-containing protein [Clostridiales bacterium]
MNQHVKNYFFRGLLFGGFGPIVMGIVLCILQLSGVGIVLDGFDVVIAVVSTYILAFVQAGSSVFNQIDSWPIAKSLGIHFSSLYVVYVACYLVNKWLPFDWRVIAIFSGVFVAVYLGIWLTVYFVVKCVSKKLNKNINPT